MSIDESNKVLAVVNTKFTNKFNIIRPNDMKIEQSNKVFAVVNTEFNNTFNIINDK